MELPIAEGVITDGFTTEGLSPDGLGYDWQTTNGKKMVLEALLQIGQYCLPVCY